MTRPSGASNLPEATLAWVAAAVGPDAAVVSVRPLSGGGWHVNHLVTVASGQDRPHRLVLRRWARADWAIEDPDMTPTREASVLDRLERAGAPTPRVIAIDPQGLETGVPALLETALPGRRISRPTDRAAFADRLAEPLRWIHAIPVDPIKDAASFPYRRFYDPAALEPPPWARNRGAWERAIEIARRPSPRAATGFMHRDYHPGNVLWSGPAEDARITGIVDWTSASVGPFSIDLGHMRWNLAAAYDRATADRFLSAARRLGLADAWSPEWDIRSTLDVVPELRLGHDSAASLRRTEEHIARALVELG